MSKDDSQDNALNRLVTLVTTAAQQTVLRTVVDLVENQEYATKPLVHWCQQEIERLEKLKGTADED